MTELLIGGLLLIPVVVLVLIARNFISLFRESRQSQSRLDEQAQLIARLTQRVWDLENQRSVLVPSEPFVAKPSRQPSIVPEPAVAPERPTVQSAVPPEDWETRVGANWLNRLGALILVIGIALFLGYSLTQLGPAGKLAIGVATGVALLLAGTVLERQDLYRTWSLGLMGSGWAILYFAAYASHGLPAARVIDDPGVAVVLLMLVSGGMIAHALRYRSETATAIAYVLGFVGLNVSPLTSFSVLASLILAVSLIGLAYRFDWFRLPLLGVTMTYLTFALRYDASIYGQAGLFNGQATLWIYWLVFETYDLLDVRRRGRGRGVERTVFLLNATGFAGASLLHEWRMTSTDWSVFLGLASLAYLASAILRSRWAERETDALSAVEGGYEAAASISALLMAGALIERYSGINMTLALLFEAELVFLSGMALKSAWLQNFGSLMLLLPLGHLVLDIFEGGQITIWGRRFDRWTPTAALMAGVFIMNRSMLRRGWYFAAAAAGLLALVADRELPDLWLAPVLALTGLGLTKTRSRDVVWVGVATLAAAYLRALNVNVDRGEWVGALIAVAGLYAAQLWWDREKPVRMSLSVMGTILLTAMVWKEASPRLLTVMWGIEASGLLAAGFVLTERIFRLSGLALFVMCLVRLFAWDLSQLDTINRILSFVILGVVLLAASWVYTRYKNKLDRLL